MLAKIEDLFIKSTDTILMALKVIDKAGQNGTKVAFVVDKSKKLLGIVNDGDIRRALLKNPTLEQSVSSIMMKNFISVSENSSRTAVLDKMKSLAINQIPELDENGVVVGLHLLRDFVDTNPLPNVAIVMAGGKGTRLYPLTENLPKPMIKVAGVPILEHIIHHLVGSGIKKIYLSVNFMSEIIEDYFKDGSSFGCSIDYLRETKPLGTAGALSLLPKLNENFLLMNGDLITQFDVRTILNSHKKNKNIVTIGTYDHLTKIPYGVLKVNKEEVLEIKEKPELHNLVNAGIYILNPQILQTIPKNQIYFATDIINNCFSKNEKVGYHLLEDDWIDVGEHKQLENARGGS